MGHSLTQNRWYREFEDFKQGRDRVRFMPVLVTCRNESDAHMPHIPIPTMTKQTPPHQLTPFAYPFLPASATQKPKPRLAGALYGEQERGHVPGPFAMSWVMMRVTWGARHLKGKLPFKLRKRDTSRGIHRDSPGSTPYWGPTSWSGAFLEAEGGSLPAPLPIRPRNPGDY